MAMGDRAVEAKWLRNRASVFGVTTLLRKQKFMVLYNLLLLDSESTDEADFDSMCSFVNGPLYLDAYQHTKIQTGNPYIEQYKPNQSKLDRFDEQVAEVAYFIVETMNDEKLSDFFHGFDFYKDTFTEGKLGNECLISEENITEYDKRGLNLLKITYPYSYVKNLKIFKMENTDKVFICNNLEYRTLLSEYKTTLENILREEEGNPEQTQLYVRLDNESQTGGIIID